MNNLTLQLKIKQRLNKLDSQDYDSVESWQIIEAFNKGQVTWVRRQLHGSNMFKEGDEQSNRRIDDLQVLLTDTPLALKNKQQWFEAALPPTYLEWKRVNVTAKSECCPNRKMKVYLEEEGNLDEIINDESKKPSFDWGETITTLKDNKVFIHTLNEFQVTKAILTHYRQPRRIEIQGVEDPYTLVISAANVECEFKDDIIEILIDEAVSILAGDIESGNQKNIASESTERNN